MDQNLRVDCHVHTVFSGHGTGSIDDAVAAAEDLDLATIAFTEHLGMPDGWDPDNDFSMSEASLNRYHDDIMAARERSEGLDIVYGAEADWLGDVDYITAHARGFDYLLGSVHFVDGWAFDNPRYVDGWDSWGNDRVWTRYFEVWCEAASSNAPFDVMSHPDLVKKFGRYPSFDVRELYSEAARVAAENDRMIEINTSGARKPVGEFYPSAEFLRFFHDAGVDCAVGSDAHDPADIFSGIPDALTLAASVGYDDIVVPTSGGGRKRLVIGRGI